MASKWRNGEGTFETEEGSIDLELGLNSTKARDSLSFDLRNPETDNPVRQAYIDEETGEEVASSHYGCARAIEIGEEEAVFERGQLKELKEKALSDSMNPQKVVDREDFDMARVDKKAYHLTPGETEKKYALMWHGLQEAEKVILVKYAPSTSENLYALWSDDRGLWLSQVIYPEGFETAEFEVPDLSEKLEQKAESLIHSIEEATNGTEIVNDQRERIEEAVEKKMAGEELDVASEEEEEEQELEEELEAVL